MNGYETVTEVAIHDICDCLEQTYGNPRHGNKSNPLDELIYIILSTRTHDPSFRETYRRLKRAYPSWSVITFRDRRRIERVLRPGGLGRLKAEQIIAIIQRLRGEFGRATLAPLKKMADEEAESFLISLPGVGAKVAKCVLMYSMGRECLPVDAHVHRFARRLGFTVKRRPDTSQNLIEAAVPPQLRYGFHVNAVAHGRTVCLAQKPKCEVCCVNKWCHYTRIQSGN